MTALALALHVQAIPGASEPEADQPGRQDEGDAVLEVRCSGTSKGSIGDTVQLCCNLLASAALGNPTMIRNQHKQAADAVCTTVVIVAARIHHKIIWLYCRQPELLLSATRWGPAVKQHSRSPVGLALVALATMPQQHRSAAGYGPLTQEMKLGLMHGTSPISCPYRTRLPPVRHHLHHVSDC